MKQFSSEKQKIGLLGENLCSQWLKANGYKILERNYGIYEGEVDIIAKKAKAIHFIEVKSIRYSKQYVLYETYNPFDNISRKKIARIKKAMFHYLRNKNVSCETYQCDAYAVFIDIENKKHKIRRINNIF